MKLSRILLLVVSSVAAGMLVNTSPAHAIQWTLNNFTYSNGQYTGSGSFDYDSSNGSYSNINITFTKVATAQSFTFTDANSHLSAGWANNYNAIDYVTNGWNGTTGGYFHIDGATPFSSIGTVAASGGYFNVVQLGTGGNVNLDAGGTLVGNYQAGDVTVPFDIPGGATVPAFGALLALGAMRKARKNIALKTRLANSVAATIS
ncbi:hypothetical protein [Halotia branconii]|uniref:PEP-CTERM protein-sorting domain-containing protein n=1 Tax=Halotia branconii CENA392 TaxID=1539056 RepID=A0AAJ6PCK2_9CYAN|nr:hypothetical protein [Halotia branconii]WGV28995.1 hypothetical protein QI031_31030 [Halotia branconii CENA392]